MSKAADKTEFANQLEFERKQFQTTLPPDSSAILQNFPGRIGVVLSGGGARGAYEAGVLLAFQDAGLPTHIIAATSIGSINAAIYAGHSDTLVGNAEPLVQTWCEVTPPAVGIDWFRYIMVLAGLVAATAGFGNLFQEWFNETGIVVHFHDPKLTWFMLGLTGAAILFFYDKLSYLGHVISHYFKNHKWRPDRRKFLRSLAANSVVWGCGILFLGFTHIHLATQRILSMNPRIWLLLAAIVILLFGLGLLLRSQISLFSHRFLRLPLRTGLFPNFERLRFLRDRIPVDRLRKSPIRVLMTAADVNTGTEKFFTNATHEQLIADIGSDSNFVRMEIETADDLLMAAVASSAFPIVYEMVPMNGVLWTDGGIVSNQPIRPAIRLGADVLFLVLVEPRSQRRGEFKTFLDLGVRAIDVLMSHNLKTDLKILSNVNALCEKYAAEMGVRPEQIRLEVAGRIYRYLKAFTVEPAEKLAATVLDFDGKITAPAVASGYRDGATAVAAFVEYLSQLPADLPKCGVRLAAQSTFCEPVQARNSSS